MPKNTDNSDKTTKIAKTKTQQKLKDLTGVLGTDPEVRYIFGGAGAERKKLKRGADS